METESLPLKSNIERYREVDMHLRSSQGEMNLVIMGSVIVAWAFIMVTASTSSNPMVTLWWFLGASLAILPVTFLLLGLTAIAYQKTRMGKERLRIADEISRDLAQRVSDGTVEVTEADISPLIHYFSRQGAGDDVQIKLEGSYLVTRVNGYERAKAQVRALIPEAEAEPVTEIRLPAVLLKRRATA